MCSFRISFSFVSQNEDKKFEMTLRSGIIDLNITETLRIEMSVRGTIFSQTETKYMYEW